MTREVSFWVDGVPVAQGSKVPGITKQGRMFVREDNAAALRKWRRAIRDAAETQRLDVIRQSPLHVQLGFVLPCSAKRTPGDWCAVRPDIDKLTRAVLDALTQAKVFVDDAQVVTLLCRKRYGNRPGVSVLVRDAGITSVRTATGGSDERAVGQVSGPRGAGGPSEADENGGRLVQVDAARADDAEPRRRGHGADPGGGDPR